MLIAYLTRKTLEPQVITTENKSLLVEAVWIDLLSPTKDEEALVEQCLGLDIPTREEMVEIELSSRLYKEHNAFFMTATMVSQHATDPILDPVTFILTPQRLVTVRYSQPNSFKVLALQLHKADMSQYHPLGLLLDILDATIDRLADALELVGHRMEEYSKTIFRPATMSTKIDYLHLLQQIGANGDLNTKARESLVAFSRLIIFFSHVEETKVDTDKQMRLATLSKDIDSLSDHANFLSTKINFLLDATLGMVSIEQNNIIKIFSVAAVIFLPPTLVASIYGMNFRHMPELSWKYGYIMAVTLIAIAAWLPYKYFKHKKWL